MAVCTFLDGVTQDQIRELIPAEQIQAKLLKGEGLLGDIKVAMPRKTVFIDVYSESEEKAMLNLLTLPLAKLWKIDLYETTPPAGSNF